MTRKQYTTLSTSQKEKMFLEYKDGKLTKAAISRKYGVNKNVLDRLIRKFENGESFENFTGKFGKSTGRPKENFQTVEEELEYRRMAMAIEKKFRALKKLKSQRNSE